MLFFGFKIIDSNDLSILESDIHWREGEFQQIIGKGNMVVKPLLKKSLDLVNVDSALISLESGLVLGILSVDNNV